MAEVTTTAELRDFLGVSDDKDMEIAALRASAIAYIDEATGRIWEDGEDVDKFNDALRARVFMTYYGVRDGAKNMEFLDRYLTDLIISMRYATGVGEA